MHAPAPRSRPLLALAGMALLALAGCGASSAGDVRLRAASMTTPTDDQRLPTDSAAAIRNSPP